MALHFTKANQSGLLNIAAEATASHGWRKDALALGAYDQGNPDDLRAVVVFQNIDAHGAEMHFAILGNHRVGPELIRSIAVVATHPNGMNLPSIWVHIADDNIPAQVAALKCGFQFEYRKRSSAVGWKDAIVLSVRRVETLGEEAAPAKPVDNLSNDSDL